MLHLPDAAAVDAAASALARVSGRPLRPRLSGVSAFGGAAGPQVLFLELADDSERREVCALQARVAAAFAAAGLPLADDRVFTPHVTIAKARARAAARARMPRLRRNHADVQGDGRCQEQASGAAAA